MSLDLAKLENVRKLDGGIVKARCPACAEAGKDRTGIHLRILADGRFGCCVHPKDGEHRKRIYALAGEKTPRGFRVRVVNKIPSRVSQSVQATLSTFNLGTLGTPLFNPYAYRRENSLRTYKDLEKGVPGVPSGSATEIVLPPTCGGERLPFLATDGTLVIPFDSPERYHWWKGGQSVKATRAELEAAREQHGPAASPLVKEPGACEEG